MKKAVIFSFGILCVVVACQSKTENTQTKSSSSSKKKSQSNQNLPKIDSGATDLDQMMGTIKHYFNSLNQGKYQEASQNFAPKVKQWITIKNTTPQAIASEAQRFLSIKQGVKYTPDFKGIFADLSKENKVRLAVRQQWVNYDTTLEVWLEFDENFKIKSHKEGKILKKLAPKVARLEALLEKIKKVSFPFETNGVDLWAADSSKSLSSEEMKMFGEEYYEETAMNQFFHIGYFTIHQDIVGVIHCYRYRELYYVRLATFGRTSGKRIDIQDIAFWGHDHVGRAYAERHQDGTLFIDEELIVNKWEFVETVRETNKTTKSGGEQRFEIRRNGVIKKVTKE